MIKLKDKLTDYEKALGRLHQILEATSPRPTIKAAFKEGLIDDGTCWLKMLEDRKQAAHTYDEQTAYDIFDHIRNDYIHLLDQLVVKMTEVVKQ